MRFATRTDPRNPSGSGTSDIPLAIESPRNKLCWRFNRCWKSPPQLKDQTFGLEKVPIDNSSISWQRFPMSLSSPHARKASPLGLSLPSESLPNTPQRSSSFREASLGTSGVRGLPMHPGPIIGEPKLSNNLNKKIIIFEFSAIGELVRTLFEWASDN